VIQQDLTTRGLEKPDALAAPSIPDLLRRLVEDGNHLVRTEIRLAKAEVRDNLTSAKAGAGAVAVGGILLLCAVFTLLGAAVGFLTPLVGAGFAALIVGLVAALIGGLLVVSGGKKIGGVSVVPDRSADSVRRDVAVIKGN
jgi:VIT1/CCC1 family predicted Fe2+/Mn2+ transporter